MRPSRHLGGLAGRVRSPVARVAAGLALAVLALWLLVQALVTLAVREVTDDYVGRFMRGTVELLQHELAALPAGGAQVPAQTLVLGPLDPDWNPEHRLNLPRELWLQGAAALGLALAVGLLASALLLPAWRDLVALRRAADALAAGRFDTPLPEPRSRAFAPLVGGLRATLERLAGALATQRELTGAISHELRTPLARLRFGVDALVDDADRDSRARAAAACERDVEELEALVDASLTLARLDLGALRAEPRPGDLDALLRREAAAMAPLLGALAFDTALDLPAGLRFDDRLLPYALRNGLRNAARHARSRVVLRAAVEGARVVVDVDDDGEGVPEAQREAVFTPFRRGDGPRERAAGGYGLGLAVVQRVARAHGGAARIEASPLGGARLRVEWPGA